MGQTKNVSIINLVAQNTIEHRMLSVLKFKSSVAAGILDNGEDSIFLGEDRFKQFMESVEAITQQPEEKAAISFDAEERREIAPADNKKGKQEDIIHSILEDEPAEQQPQAKDADNSRTDEISSTSLVHNGMTFFSQLVNTLSNQQSVKKLVETITEKDEKTGQTWLKLPVENEQTIEKALHLIAGFLKGFGK
jgi:hypothetical protein